MTRARALKQTIRARAARTGERYTTARRQILKDTAAAPPTEDKRPATPAMPPAKGGLSDAKAREKTGHGLDHWFSVLDRFGGVEQGHSASARHLYDDHGVDGWYAQGITVAYERARGLRALNQRMSGDYEVSVSKVVAADAPAIVKAFTSARQRSAWLARADADLAGALTTAVKAGSSKGFVLRPDGLGRFRYKWGTTTVQFYLIPKAGGRTSVVVTHMKLADESAVEARRVEWRAALNALARMFTEE